MWKLAMGSVVLVTATQVSAVSLGAAQGSVVIGRPLDVLVQSSITAAEAASGLCLEADVLYGDVRVPPTAVTVAIHQIGADGTGALRIRATPLVNEPIVTVAVRAGCGASFRRAYTLLADVEPAPAASASRAGTRLSPTSSTPSAATRSSAIGSGTVTSGASQGAASPADATEETPIRLSAPAPRPAAVTRMVSKTRPLPTVAPADANPPPQQASGAVSPVAPPPPSGPRLQLEPVDVTATPSTVPAGSEPAGPVSMGAESASLPVTPETVQQEALQREVEALRAEQERMRLALETVNAQLREAQAQSAQGTQTLWWGVGGLGLLLLGGLWTVARNRRKVEPATPSDRVSVPWWESALPPTAEPDDANRPDAGAARQPTAPAASAASTLPPAWAPDPVEGLEVAEGGESMFREVPIAPLDPERLQDVWQRVAFCRSIGQTREAMEALKELVTEAPRCSEAPYLLWLQLAHEQGTEADRAAATRFYESHFQRVAQSSGALDRATGLEHDGPYTQGLVQRWPSDDARLWVLKALSSQPGALDGVLSVRSAEAFDDLVMLLGTLDHLQSMPDEGSSVSSPLVAAVAPLVSAPPSASAATTVQDDLDTEFLSWQSVASIPLAPAPKPPLDFELPLQVTPPAPGEPVPPSPPASSAPLDFDFGDLELEPKSPPATPKVSND